MYKFFLSLLVGSSLTYAAMINGVALTVNDEPITLYDIDRTMVINKVSKNEAVSYLVDKILYVSMKPESKDRIFLVRTDIACVSHTNLFVVL